MCAHIFIGVSFALGGVIYVLCILLIYSRPSIY